MLRANLKVALVHDLLVEYGGAERVLLALARLFPEARVYVGMVNLPGLGAKEAEFSALNLSPTYLQKIPGHLKLRSPLRLLAPGAFARLDLSAYDLVISSTSAYHAKAIRVRPGAVHLCYCHTPARSLYGFETRSDWRRRPLTHLLGRVINRYLIGVDQRTAQNPTAIIANSKETAARIKKYWGRESRVIYPPVALLEHPALRVLTAKQDYYLYVNRLNYAKHPELAVQACLQLKLPLKVVGTGPLLPALRRLVPASPAAPIEFLGSVDDAALIKLYQGAQALLYPVVDEDFGLVPVEAMACGTPVVAHRSGGPKETIVSERTGVFFDQLTVDGLVRALKHAQRLKFSPERLCAQARKFAPRVFQTQMQEVIAKNMVA